MISCCGYCPHNGNVVLTTYPPKVRCELTGKLHFTKDSCDADVVAVVRCKDCKWYYVLNGHDRCDLLDLEARDIKPDWFCADGERREDAEIQHS